MARVSAAAPGVTTAALVCSISMTIRTAMLPECVKEPLLRHLERVRQIHEDDLRQGAGRVSLPDAICRKYPNADREWGWRFVFPALAVVLRSRRLKSSGVITFTSL
jgi:hypothetical protein